MFNSSSKLLTPEDEATIRKLESLKELRDVHLQLSDKRAQLFTALKALEEEAKCLKAFKIEKALIEQEREAHCAELMLIRDDVNQMDAVIQESELEKNQHLAAAKSLAHKMEELTEQANKLKSAIGLGQFIKDSDDQDLLSLFKKMAEEDPNSDYPVQLDNPYNPLLVAPNQHQLQPHPYLFAPPAPSSSRDFRPSIGPHPSRMGIAPLLNPHSGPPSGLMSSRSSTNSVVRPANRSSFCQQPPPMKSCLTCFQQIHRNAPICPNCKAKSRSRNPKKAKRKQED